jgi:segregation and condensation protein A
MNSATYKVKIDHFEGPFDLLLYFIQRDELDIHDIDISKITDDFLAYVRELERLDIDVASEFILVAATLMRIKAKMLIPRKELDEEGVEIDPRQELVQRLLEYKQYKDVISQFVDKEKERAQKLLRGNAALEIKALAEESLVDVELESLTTYKLFRAFQAVLLRFQNREDKYVHQIVKYPYTLKDQSAFLRAAVADGRDYEFAEIFGQLDNRMHAIVTFLAMLELLNAQVITLLDSEKTNNFFLRRGKDYDQTPQANLSEEE